MAIDINNIGDCTSGAIGTGVRACDIYDYGDPKGIVLFEKGYSTDVTDGIADFELADYKNLSKKFNSFSISRNLRFHTRNARK